MAMAELLQGVEARHNMEIGALFGAIGAAMLVSSVELIHLSSQTDNLLTQGALLVGAASTLVSGTIMTLAGANIAHGEWKKYRNSSLAKLRSSAPYEPIIVLDEARADLCFEPVREPVTNPRV